MFVILPGGVRIIENKHLTKTVEDWSRVRSPSRALRRMRRGFRQNVRLVIVPRGDLVTFDNGRSFYGHPETVAKIKTARDGAAIFQ